MTAGAVTAGPGSTVSSAAGGGRVAGLQTGAITVQYSTVQYSTVQCSAVQYSTVPHQLQAYSAYNTWKEAMYHV